MSKDNEISKLPKSNNRDQAIIEIKKMIKKGHTSYDIVAILKDKYNLKESLLKRLFIEANDIIKRENDFNMRDIVIQNTALYEAIWSKNIKNPYSKKLDNPDDDLDDEDGRKTLYKIAKHYETAAEALNRKEKMLGMVHSRMDVQLTNEYEEYEAKENDSLENFDPSKLTMEENLEFLELLKKAKGEEVKPKQKITTTVTITTNNVDKDPPKYESVVDQFDVETIDYEEVKEDLPPQILVQQMSDKVAKEEAEKLHNELESRKEFDKSKRALENKRKLLSKLGKKK